tara:strand:+ start:4375 stop:4758 length:384 start_codon:yes stop_codon:yes gene_type:complete
MSKNDKNIKDGFSDIEKSDKTIWRADQFGKRVVEDLESFINKSQIDNQTYPSSFKKNTEKHKELKKELIRRIKILYKSGKTYKYSIRKTIKKTRGKNVQKKLEKLSDKKLEKLYKSLLNKKTRKKRR